jgi:hypothetical protein
VIILILVAAQDAKAQGFENLNFESANIAGYSPNSSDVPISAALPGWSGFYGSSQASEVWYDGISIGGAMISVIDDNAPAFAPLQGNFSAFLFGGGGIAGLSASISQTATISAGTQSITMDAWEYDASPIVAINGLAINMIPLQTFANYTVYGGTVPTADVGPSVTLSFTDPAPATGGPSMFELDNISFSTNVVASPEPNMAALTAIGGLLFGARKCFARRS